MNFRRKMKSFEVIGVVGDVRFANLTRIDPAHVYLPGSGDYPGGVMLRLRGERRKAIDAVKAIAGEDAGLSNLDEVFVESLRALSRGLAGFAAVLAGLALALSAIGIYGVVSYLVGQRTKEIGIRMALGARGGAVLRNVVMQPFRPVFVGMACGMAMAAVLSALLHQTLIFPGSMDLFYGVPFYDPATFCGLICFVSVVAIVACLAPARRALRVDPVIALRYE
jgi:predicted lysophospholipase L1 biosynthesis ABC-type transport system permease subunit